MPEGVRYRSLVIQKEDQGNLLQPYCNPAGTSWYSTSRWRRLIEEWHDREIIPGQEWEEAIDEHLRTSVNYSPSYQTVAKTVA